jgi:hypothetical protein
VNHLIKSELYNDLLRLLRWQTWVPKDAVFGCEHLLMWIGKISDTLLGAWKPSV